MNLLRQVLAHLHAGRWNEAHQLVQHDASPLAAWLHGILHLQEGDLEDAEYWYGQARQDFRRCGRLDEEIERFEAALANEDGHGHA
jgi:hypothetical protein